MAPTLSELAGMAAQHPNKILRDDMLADYTDDDLIDAAVDYLHEQALLQSPCIDKGNCKARSCNCLEVFAEKEDEPTQGSPLTRSVARFMVYFAKKDHFKEQQPIVIEWIKYAGNIANANKNQYLLPRICLDDDNTEGLDDNAPEIPKVCYSALLTILGYGRGYWDTCKKHAKAGTLPVHGLTGRPSNTPVNEELQESMDRFFNEIACFAEPRATRFTRERTGQLDTRDEDDDSDFLPPNFKKRALYGRFCYERGWLVETSTNGATTTKKRKDDEWIALHQEPKSICSWAAFWRKWPKDFPNLKISSPAADICGECHKFSQRMKYRMKEGEKRTSVGPKT
jgi:hypothetical protein